MTDNYSILIGKLDEFIRKYYKNQLLRGGLYCFAAFLLFFLLTNSIEYFANLEPLPRTLLFYLYLLSNVLILAWLVISPLFKLYRIGKVISHEQAALIIGRHFANVKDRLLNTLQLQSLNQQNPENTDLVIASINQRINELKPIPFTRAIDLRQNRKYLKFVIPPLLIIVVLLFAAPSFITEPTTRLIHHGVYYEKKAPYQINILNSKLEAIQQEDFTLDVKITGDQVPDNILIEYDNAQYHLNRENNVLYHYKFKNIQKSISFQIVTADTRTKEYELNVLPKPIVLNFDVMLNYPAYIRKQDEKLQNTGDVIVPYGTRISWKFYTRDTRSIWLRFKDKIQKLEQKNSNAFDFSEAFMQSQTYSITTYNEYLKNHDSLIYTINVIPDAYPSITAEEYRDSVYEKRLYFKGLIKDDYGFNRLTFNYHIVDNKDTNGLKEPLRSDTLKIDKNTNKQEFFHFFDLASLNISPGAGVEYYFEVWDNDGISGSKSTRSQKMFFKVPTLTELSEKTEKADKKLKDDLEQTLREARELQKKVEELNKNLFDKKELGWQEKKQIKDLLNREEELKNKVEKISKENKENSIKEQQFHTPEERIMEKQRQQEELMDQVLPQDMKKMLEEMQKMLENMDKNKVNDMLDKIKLNSEDLEKQLDRNLELLKQLQFEKKLENNIEKLNQMEKEENKLSEDAEKKDEEKSNDNKELQDKQDALNKDFEKLGDDMKEMEKMNKELEEPNKMESTEEQQKDIKEDMKKSSESLKNKKNKKASQSQKNAAKKMKDMADKLDKMKDGMEQEEMEEDIQALRKILGNLLKISFDQEELMVQTNKARTYDPKYVNMIQQQNKVKDGLKLVEDSLFALSKRQAAIKPVINREITEVNLNVDRALEEMTERRTPTAAQRQQLVMTGVNNLALLLQENMNQMQQQSQESKSGMKSGCKNPSSGKGKGKGKMSMKGLQKMQENLNRQMEKMKEQMGKEGKDGKEGQGSKSGQGKQSMSEGLARMAAEQSEIRRQMQEIRDEIAKEGKGNTGNMNQAIQDMEQTETDLVNKMITNQTLQRQKEILTRLLESEKSVREREKEERRESTEAKNQNYSNPKNFFEYNRIKSRETELLKTVPPTLKPFYKNKVSAYFYNFED